MELLNSSPDVLRWLGGLTELGEDNRGNIELNMVWFGPG